MGLRDGGFYGWYRCIFECGLGRDGGILCVEDGMVRWNGEELAE